MVGCKLLAGTKDEVRAFHLAKNEHAVATLEYHLKHLDEVAKKSPLSEAVTLATPTADGGKRNRGGKRFVFNSWTDVESLYADASKPFLRIWTSAERCKRYVLGAYNTQVGGAKAVELQYQEIVEWKGKRSADAGIQYVGACMLHPPDVAHPSSLLMLATDVRLDVDTRVTFVRRFSRTQALVAFDAFAWLPDALRHQLVVPMSAVVMEDGGKSRAQGEEEVPVVATRTDRLQACRAMLECGLSGQMHPRDVMTEMLVFLEDEEGRLSRDRKRRK